MILSWSHVTPAEGSAAHGTATLVANAPVVDGAVLPAAAMPAILAERQEQLDALLKALNRENRERVASELKRTILTVHVPREVQEALDGALEALGTPVLMRLSPIGEVADPLAPAMVIGIEDGKTMLDAARMLYAELYSEDNLAIDGTDRSAAIIVQRQPACVATWRVIRSGEHTVLEGTRGLGCWVGYGEPDRFLFTNGTFDRAEHGDVHGVRWTTSVEEFARVPLGGDDAAKVLAFATPYLERTEQPVLIAQTDNGFLCLGTGPATH